MTNRVTVEATKRSTKGGRNRSDSQSPSNRTNNDDEKGSPARALRCRCLSYKHVNR